MYFEINKWHKIPDEDRRVYVNTNYVAGKNRFICRYQYPFKESVGDADTFLKNLPKGTWTGFTCGHEAWPEKYGYYAISISDYETAVQFQLMFCS